MSGIQRRQDVETFYDLLAVLEAKLGGTRTLNSCSGRDRWPERGLYFFFEPEEFREASERLRVVRIGTHALTPTSRTTLWNRLSQHRGTGSGSGNHRGSIFRLHVGAALIARSSGGIHLPTWGIGSSAPKEVTVTEVEHERRVSEHIGRMPFLWLAVPDAAGPSSERGFLERNLIALLAGPGGNQPADAPSRDWLGHYSTRPSIRQSGLWNVRHIGEGYMTQRRCGGWKNGSPLCRSIAAQSANIASHESSNEKLRRFWRHRSSLLSI